MAPRGGHRGLLGVVGDFCAAKDGATVVEFALVVTPFVTILLGLLELALIFIVNISLGLATESFATQLRTGQFQAPGLSATSSSGAQIDLADATTLLCNQIPIVSLSTCKQQLQLDVRPLTTFGQTASSTPISGGTFNSSNLCFYSGLAGGVVEIRAYYLYSIIDPLLLAAFSSIGTYVNSSGSSSGYFYPITTTQVFKSENYSSGVNTGAGC
jgi:Flp pilus assembly protein TadG